MSPAMVLTDTEETIDALETTPAPGEQPLATLAIHLWQAGSCPSDQAEEEWQDEPETVACHASCL
jgi:hypothetical protein